MNTILISAVLSSLLYAIWAPPSLIFIVGIGGLAVVVTVVLAIHSAMAPVSDSEHSAVNRLSVKLNSDLEIGNNLRELYVLFALQIIDFLFLRQGLIILFIGIGSMLVAKRLIDYLEETYYEDIVLAVQNMNNSNKKDRE